MTWLKPGPKLCLLQQGLAEKAPNARSQMGVYYFLSQNLLILCRDFFAF